MKTTLRWAALFLVVGSALQAEPLATPIIVLSPGSFIFNVPEGGPNPAPQTLQIKNNGTGNLDWVASVDQPWLSLSKASGKLPTQGTINIDVLVDVGGRTSQTYTATITVREKNNDPQVPQQTAGVEMRVSSVPRLEVTPTTFSFSAPQGSTPPSQTLTIKNTGGGLLDWSYVVNQPWVQLGSVPQDLGPAASQLVQVSVIPGSLSAGTTHQAKITISAPSNADVEVNVFFTINLNPAIGLAPTSLTFDAPQNGPNPAAKQFTVKNEGGGTLSWTASDNQTWLTLNPTTGNLASGQSQVVTATVDVLSPVVLVEATYSATISVTGNAPTQTLGVTLNVNSIATIGVNPQSLSFTMAMDTVTSPIAAVSITNTGSGTLSWTATSGANWARFSPSGGSLNTLQSQPLQVTPVSWGMTPGVYTTNIQIVAPGASNSPRNIAVEMTVTESALPISAPAGQCGLMGLELVGVALLLRFLKSRGGPSCTSR